MEAQRQVIERLEARVAELERQLGQHSGNSGKPPSRDPAAERQRQAEERKRRAEAGGTQRRRGKQRGTNGKGQEMSATPDEVVDHRPPRCEGCGAELGEGTPSEFSRPSCIRVANQQELLAHGPGEALGQLAGDARRVEVDQSDAGHEGELRPGLSSAAAFFPAALFAAEAVEL